MRIHSRRLGGKDDAGEDLPMGKYRAADMRLGAKGETLAKWRRLRTGQPISLRENGDESARERYAIGCRFAVGVDGKGSFLKTMDGLPLATLNEAPNLARVRSTTEGERRLLIFGQDDGLQSNS